MLDRTLELRRTPIARWQAIARSIHQNQSTVLPRDALQFFAPDKPIDSAGRAVLPVQPETVLDSVTQGGFRVMSAAAVLYKLPISAGDLKDTFVPVPGD